MVTIPMFIYFTLLYGRAPLEWESNQAKNVSDIIIFLFFLIWLQVK